MICPKCLVQMHQKIVDGIPVGNGWNDDDKYATWEVKECPACNRLVHELYQATVTTPEAVSNFVDQKQRKTGVGNGFWDTESSFTLRTPSSHLQDATGLSEEDVAMLQDIAETEEILKSDNEELAAYEIYVERMDR